MTDELKMSKAVNELKNAINSNTLVMQKLCDKLESTP